MTESPGEKQALEKLDEATREVAWDEATKDSERRFIASLIGWRRLGRWNLPGLPRFTRTAGDPVPEPVDDPDPGGGPSVRGVMHEKDGPS